MAEKRWLPDNEPAEVLSYDKELLGGCVPINVPGFKEVLPQNEDGERLYSYGKPKREDVILRAVPYYTWGNRGENQMRVFMGR